MVLNAGSSSLKFAVFTAAALQPYLRGQVAGIGGEGAELRLTPLTAQAAALAGAPSTPGSAEGEGADVGTARTAAEQRHALSAEAGADTVDHRQALEAVLGCLEAHRDAVTLIAAGHRVVHGGVHYHAPVAIDAAVLADLQALEPLAPLHQPHNLAAIAAVRRLAPQLPQVACFDTAFHRTQPAVAQRFALPRRYAEQGILRYGFHGLSYEGIAARLAEIDPPAAAGRCVVAHLGAGASLCALQGGRSVATTMGFTALDGMPMGQRCGTIDPGVVLHLQRVEGLTLEGMEQLLYRESGLLGLSGLSADMRHLLESDDSAAAEAVEFFCYRAVREIGSLAAALGGLDALIFTAGIGEHAAPVRERIMAGLSWLGLELDAAANAGHGPRLTTAQSRVRAWVVATDEEHVIAAHTRAQVCPPPPADAAG
nr:acetate/propionate family kinase [Halorhodospira abdelmalekii]